MPHPLLLVLCVGEQLPDVCLRLAHVFVQDLGAVHHFGLSGVQHLPDLTSHQSLSTAGGSEQHDALHVLTAWRQEKRHEEEGTHGDVEET